MSDRPPATELLRTPGAMLTRTDLRDLGLERAIDAVFRKLPVTFGPSTRGSEQRDGSHSKLTAGSRLRHLIPGGVACRRQGDVPPSRQGLCCAIKFSGPGEA